MPASRSTTDSSKSMLYALIIFLVLFLASGVLALVMYMNMEQLRNDTAAAEEELAQLGSSSELNAVRPLTARARGGRSVTALSQITGDMRYMAALIGGVKLAQAPLVGIRLMIDKELALVWEQLDGALTNSEEGDRSAGLSKIVQALIRERNAWASRYVQTEMEKDSQKGTLDEKVAVLEGQIGQLNELVKELSEKAQTNEKMYAGLLDQQTEKYEGMMGQLSKEINDLVTVVEKAENEKKLLEAQGAGCERKVRDLERLLQQVRPSPEMEMEALEADGYVVSVVPRDDLAYINLTSADHIYRGLTFTVYDRFEEIPKTGQGKGALEVIEIMDTISKCRITSFDPTDPIMEDDVIANLIWNADRKYLFCVVGDFDFDGDGAVEEDGGERVGRLIDNWGGQLTETLAVDTDFLVVGRRPTLPARPAEEYIDSNAPEAVRYRQAKARQDAYEQVRADGAALGVPTFPLKRFLYFIGYYQQASNLR